MTVPYGADEAVRFQGNTTSKDHFRLLQSDGEFVLVGARNAVYNLSMPTMVENKKVEWFALEDHVKMCQLKGRSEEECQNYIRVLAMKSPGRLLLCGTHAYKPMCREYAYKEGEYVLEKQVNGQGVSPYDPSHNSTAVLVDGELFVGTVADFSGMDPLIYREPLRTEQYDATNLNAPNFVSSFAHGDYVYFTFRETAVEFMNCGKTVYSRIARVCKSDRGGPHKFRYRWTSFLKSRLNCSVSGDYPFYFNEIQSTAGPYESRHEGKRVDIIYATFTTPSNALSGSAVCAFRLHDVEKVFDGAFKEQAALNYNWLPVPAHKVPEPRPGQCVNDSQTLPDVTLNFIKSHSLMDESVPSMLNEPLIIRTGFHHRFTKIEVDPQVKTPEGKYYDVLFIGTDNGKVIKAIRTDSGQQVIIEEMQVFPISVPVTNMMIHRGKMGGIDGASEEARLVVSSQGEIASLKLQRCYSDKVSTCSDCVKLRDPYCAWDKRRQKCVAVGSWTLEANLFQNVNTGSHESCPDSTHGKSMVKSPPSRDNSAGYVASSSSASGMAEASLFNADFPAAPPSSSGPSRSGKSFATHSHVASDVPDGDKDDGTGAADMDAGMDGSLDLDDADDDVSSVRGNDGPRISPDESQPKYTVETLAIAVAAGSLAALFLGFVLGYCCGRKCRKNEEDNMPYPDTEYEYFEQRQNCHMRRLQDDPKLLPQEEATYAEPILMPTVNKTMTLTPSNIVQHQQQQQQTNAMHCGGGGYSATSPKATLRKVVNNHNSALTTSNNAANSQVGALFETCPSPCPSSGLYAPYSDHGNNYATANNATLSSNAVRDPYSSFRSRDAFGAGSIRSQHQAAFNGHQQQQLPPMGGIGGGGLQPLGPLDGSTALYGGTLRSSNKAANLADNYGTARSVKKVYL